MATAKYVKFDASSEALVQSTSTDDLTIGSLVLGGVSTALSVTSGAVAFGGQTTLTKDDEALRLAGTTNVFIGLYPTGVLNNGGFVGYSVGSPTELGISNGVGGVRITAETGYELYVNTRSDSVGWALSTDASQSYAAARFRGTVAKNDTNVREFHGVHINPELNTGGVNTNTTINALCIDTINTAITGLTVNLLNAKYGSAQKFLVNSSGDGHFAGSLGVGVFPTVALDVRGSATAATVARIQNNDATGYSSVNFYNNSSVVKGGFGYANASVTNALYASRMYFDSQVAFLLNANGGTTTSNLWLTTDTRVGVNTPVAPTARFQVNDDGTGTTLAMANSSLAINNTHATGQTQLVFAFSGTAKGGVRADYAGNFNWHCDTAGYHQFYYGMGFTSPIINFSDGGVIIGGTAGSKSGSGSSGATRLDVRFKSLTTEATATNAGIILSGALISKNDANTRTFTGVSIKPTLNPGGSNANTTINVLDIDTVNTTTTGLTTNLFKASYGGSEKFRIDSAGEAYSLNLGAGLVFFGTSSGPTNMVNGTAYYLRPVMETLTADTNEVFLRVPKVGRISALQVQAFSGPTGQTVVFTVRKNAVDTTLTATLATNGTQAADNTNSFTVAAGDRLSIKIAASGAGHVTAVAQPRVTLAFTSL